MMKKILTIMAVMVLTLAFAGSGFAEMVKGKFTSIKSKKPLYNARVILQDEDGGNVGAAWTDKKGVFVVEDLKPGTYKVIVFSPKRSKEVFKAEVVVEPDKTTEVMYELGPKVTEWGQVLR